MRKYREVMRVYLKAQLAWRADVAFSMLFTVSKVLFAWLLWGMVFRERDTVVDFTFHGMLSYYIVSSFLHQLEMSRGISGEISARIRNGTLSNYLVLPVNMKGILQPWKREWCCFTYFLTCLPLWSGCLFSGFSWRLPIARDSLSVRW